MKSKSYMEIGVDSFAGSNQSALKGAVVLEELLARIELADQAGLATFGIGEHRRREFFDAAPAVILAAAARTCLTCYTKTRKFISRSSDSFTAGDRFSKW
ncbi:hypothetical protein LJ707_02395 [Mucilaginibacter sp. UR6-1]|uniref:hypothetical protein n=1 Tax=Mucilaginibacter sp. UR6-1 TaxID=1435643 RepID=UPI001E57D947|nr:hypothetical protein [Mucilaginibacter sp. UR6-1]MCC8407762.1 hypothetical protein [Mucilaginibacter sp. UR6-1]